MPIIATPPPLQAGAAIAPPCDIVHLRLSAAKGGPSFRGASGLGAELSIRNIGQDCTLAALPIIELRDARGQTIPATRWFPIGMHPGPAVTPVELPGGHRAVINLSWLSGPPRGGADAVPVSSVTVQVGGVLRASMKVVLRGTPGAPLTFNQTRARAAEGLASD